MKFTYKLAGWETSAHNRRILTDAIETNKFLIPSSKYYLRDAGYSNSDYLLIPYKGVQYHLNKKKLVSQKSLNVKELFHLCHTCLCNIIERIFGEVKCWFQIFDKAPGYSQTTKVDIVYVIMGIQNFIRIYPGHEEDIYYAPIDILDNTIGDSKERTQ